MAVEVHQGCHPWQLIQLGRRPGPLKDRKCGKGDIYDEIRRNYDRDYDDYDYEVIYEVI
jgi:hypothetical protein